MDEDNILHIEGISKATSLKKFKRLLVTYCGSANIIDYKKSRSHAFVKLRNRIVTENLRKELQGKIVDDSLLSVSFVKPHVMDTVNSARTHNYANKDGYSLESTKAKKSPPSFWNTYVPASRFPTAFASTKEYQMPPKQNKVLAGPLMSAPYNKYYGQGPSTSQSQNYSISGYNTAPETFRYNVAAQTSGASMVNYPQPNYGTFQQGFGPQRPAPFEVHRKGSIQAKNSPLFNLNPSARPFPYSVVKDKRSPPSFWNKYVPASQFPTSSTMTKEQKMPEKTYKGFAGPRKLSPYSRDNCKSLSTSQSQNYFISGSSTANESFYSNVGSQYPETFEYNATAAQTSRASMLKYSQPNYATFQQGFGPQGPDPFDVHRKGSIQAKNSPLFNLNPSARPFPYSVVKDKRSPPSFWNKYVPASQFPTSSTITKEQKMPEKTYKGFAGPRKLSPYSRDNSKSLSTSQSQNYFISGSSTANESFYSNVGSQYPETFGYNAAAAQTSRASMLKYSQPNYAIFQQGSQPLQKK